MRFDGRVRAIEAFQFAGVFAALSMLATLYVWPASAASQNRAVHPTRSLGNLLYAVPPGYEAVSAAGGVMMARRSEVRSGNISGIIAIAHEIRPDPKVRASLRGKSKAEIAQALAIAAGSLERDPGAKVSPATLINDAARDRYEAYRAVTISKDENAGKTRYSAVFVIFPGDLIHVVSANGFGSEQALTAINPGVNALLASIEFRNMGGRVPRFAEPPLPSSFAPPAPPKPPVVQTPRARPGPTGRDGGSCRIVQRQMCSGGFASGMGYFCNTYPQRVCD